jgi:hypothetical protein
MCRAGGRRCKGSNASSRATQTARKQRSRAKQALRQAKATGDPEAIAAAQQRLNQANANVQAAKENIVHHNDDSNAADRGGDVTTPKPAPSPITGELSSKPVLENTWGDLLNNSPVHYHDDGPVGTAVKYMGPDARMDVDGEPLANVVGRIATDVVRRKTKAQQAVDDLKELRDRLPENSRAKRCLSQAVREMDGPDTPVPQVPDGTPEPLRDLVRTLHAVPIVRREPEREMQPLLDICGRVAAGDRRTIGLLDDEVKRLRNKRHESLGDAGKFEIDDAVNDTVMTLKEQERQRREQKRAATAASGSNTAGQSGDVTKQNAVDLVREMREEMKQREQAARNDPTNNGPIQGSVITGQSGDVTSTRTSGVQSGQPTHVTITNTATNVGIRGQNIRGATIVNGRIVDPGTSTSSNVHNHVGGEVHGAQLGDVNGGITFRAGGGFTIGDNQHRQGDVTPPPAPRRDQRSKPHTPKAAAPQGNRGTGPVTITDGDGNPIIQAGNVRGEVWIDGKRVR